MVLIGLAIVIFLLMVVAALVGVFLGIFGLNIMDYLAMIVSYIGVSTLAVIGFATIYLPILGTLLHFAYTKFMMVFRDFMFDLKIKRLEKKEARALKHNMAIDRKMKKDLNAFAGTKAFKEEVRNARENIKRRLRELKEEMSRLTERDIDITRKMRENEKNYNAVNEWLQNESVLHEVFHIESVVENLLENMEVGRVNTIQHSINMYIQETREDARTKVILDKMNHQVKLDEVRNSLIREQTSEIIDVGYKILHEQARASAQLMGIGNQLRTMDMKTEERHRQIISQQDELQYQRLSTLNALENEAKQRHRELQSRLELQYSKC